MQILVRFFEAVTTPEIKRKFLGEERLLNIEEYFLPKISGTTPVFLNKKFTSCICYRWKVISVHDINEDGYGRVLEVCLEPKHDSNEEYLSQTLKKNRKSGHKGLQGILYKGKVVEVDFGHTFDIYKCNRDIRTNKRYPSTVQGGEMHKRRLAVVVNVLPKGQVQVVPITSKEPDSADKTSFQLDQATLEKTIYHSDNIQSWVLCSMVQTVSVNRILPVEVKRSFRRSTERPRNTNYLIKISSVEILNLDRSLLHAIGLSKYENFRLENIEFKKNLCEKHAEIQSMVEEVNNLKKYKLFCEKEGMNPDDYL